MNLISPMWILSLEMFNSYGSFQIFQVAYNGGEEKKTVISRWDVEAGNQNKKGTCVNPSGPVHTLLLLAEAVKKNLGCSLFLIFS